MRRPIKWYWAGTWCACKQLLLESSIRSADMHVCQRRLSGAKPWSWQMAG